MSIKLFPGIRSIGTDRFIKITEGAGYTTTDTTEELSQDWKVGSMLEKAYSFDDGNIRMDFAVMDTVDSACVLFESMELPVSDGNTRQFGGMVREWYSAENETFFAAKIRIKNTVLYVFAQAEHTSETEELLKKLGYFIIPKEMKYYSFLVGNIPNIGYTIEGSEVQSFCI